MGRRRLGLAIFLVILTAAGCDSDGIGPFSRTTGATVAVLGSVSEDGLLTVEEIQPFVEGSDPLIVRDPFELEPEPDRSYWILLSPSVQVHRDPDRGRGQFSMLYLHDPVTDLPADSFPNGQTDGGRSPGQFLDCLRENDDGAASRFDALARAVQVGFDELAACN